MLHKVVNIFYEDDEKFNTEIGEYGTGLILELEDGTLIKQNSTDPIAPFSIHTLATMRHTFKCPDDKRTFSYPDGDVVSEKK